LEKKKGSAYRGTPQEGKIKFTLTLEERGGEKKGKKVAEGKEGHQPFSKGGEKKEGRSLALHHRTKGISRNKPTYPEGKTT